MEALEIVNPRTKIDVSDGLDQNIELARIRALRQCDGIALPASIHRSDRLTIEEDPGKIVD